MADKIKLREIFKKPLETPLLASEKKWLLVGVFAAVWALIIIGFPLAFIAQTIQEYIPVGLMRAFAVLAAMVPYSILILFKAKAVLTFCLNMGLLMEKSNSKKEALKNGVNIEKE